MTGRVLVASLLAAAACAVALPVTGHAGVGRHATVATGPLDFPAHLTCNGPSAQQGKVYPGDPVDSCVVYSDDATSLFFPANTSFTVELTLPAGVTLTTCYSDGGATPRWTATRPNSTGCAFTEKVARSQGFPLGQLSLALDSTAVPGSGIVASAAFTDFPSQNMPVNGPGAVVSARPMATATPTPSPSPSPTAPPVIGVPDTGSAAGPTVAGVVWILLTGGAVLGALALATRRRVDI